MRGILHIAYILRLSLSKHRNQESFTDSRFNQFSFHQRRLGIRNLTWCICYLYTVMVALGSQDPLIISYLFTAGLVKLADKVILQNLGDHVKFAK